MEKPLVKHIVIACCTYKRPKMLEMSLESAVKLKMPDNMKISFVVVDNDKDASAQNTVEKIQEKMQFHVHYFVEKKRGLSYVRNRVLKEAIDLGATHIAMFDDDEVLDENWICAHLDFYLQQKNVYISSGPSYAKFMQDFPAYIRKNNIFQTHTSKKTGQIRKACATNNVFFPTAIMTEKNIYFDEKYNFMGGEDGDFFLRASNAGFTIVWNNNAIAYEMIYESRANIKWILRRSYFHGFKSSYLKNGLYQKVFDKQLYFFKLFFVLFADMIILLPSLLLGRTMFFNVLGITIKTIGKISGLVNPERPDYYNNLTGF